MTVNVALALYNDTESISYSYKFNRKKSFKFKTQNISFLLYFIIKACLINLLPVSLKLQN